jgi:peptide/nickel transport system permease protein
MAKFIIRRLLLMLLTMLIVSIAVFLITEAAPGNVARNVLGIHITPAQEASFLNQMGLDEPIYERYFNWLIGTDWRASSKIGLNVEKITRENGFKEWWAVAEGGSYVRWEMEGEDLVAEYLRPDGSLEEVVENERWQVKEPEGEIERLSEHRESVLENPQLRSDDRQAILEELDRILSSLAEEQSKSDILADIEEPEANLAAMIDQDALFKKSVLQQMADDLSRENNFIRVFAAHEELSTYQTQTIDTTTLQNTTRLFTKVAEELESTNPSLAIQFENAAAHLEEDDIPAALEDLDSAAPALNALLGSIGTFVQSTREGQYHTASNVLTDLGDPAQTSFDSARLMLLPGILEAIGEELEDDLPNVGPPLLSASENMREGKTTAAQEQIARAAQNFEELTFTIARSESARGSQVARTFWGVNSQNLAVQWEKGTGKTVWRLVMGSGWLATSGGPVEYIPLQKGLLRGDPGLSLRTGRPVADLLFTRLRNSLVLAGIAFAIVMPIALVLGLIAGLNEGKPLDRILSITGMMFSVTPEFATGIFLILIFAFWLKLVPGATVFGEQAPWQRPEMLVLPVLTLTLIELGYVLRITRASMSETMKAPYIRTAFLKGLPYRRVVTQHAIRNALMSPITVIMLHVNWLLGGIVVVEVIFGYPGLGSYLLDSALFKDFNAIEGGAIILVAVAVSTQLIADIIYTFLNPRIRYD